MINSPLFTDLYQLTMAYGYWKLGIHEREAVFHQIFRKLPFSNNYAIMCGLGTVVDYIQNWRFSEDDLNYLQGLTTPNDTPLFSLDFLDYLKNLHFTCDIDAIPEGTVIFPQEPLLRIKGPLLQGQLLDTALLNIINFQTLIATKAARVCEAAKGEPVLEFGLRRAQGPDGGLSASRAAYIGGCAATSNVLGGKLFDIPVSGTHAHSWVTAFNDEISAFSAYAEVMPNNCILLVDTYDTLKGINNAIEIGERLKEKGSTLLAIRLDSGDLLKLSIEARKMLDSAGFKDTKIIASNSLDEYVIRQLKENGAKISIWGVGTHLVTAYDHPALDGVYKLSALRDKKGKWEYKLKLSDNPAKISNPGIQQVRRFFRDNNPVLDMIYDVELGIAEQHFDEAKDLLQPFFRQGKYVYQNETIQSLRKRTLLEMTQTIPDPYIVRLEKNLAEEKKRLIAEVSKTNHV